jgi:hypothetical protein
MAFMNKKEDVIDIELTQYGKYLLSLGKFRPEYYAFFDDNILYDSTYAGIISESQNNIQIRLTSDYLQSTTQYNFSGVETEVKKINKLIRSGQAKLGEDKVQPHADRNYSLVSSIGNSSLSTNFYPAFNVKYLNGVLTSSVGFLSESHSILKIPQLSSSVKYFTFQGVEDVQLLDISEEEKNIVQNNQNINILKTFDDGTNITLEKDYILLEIVEENTPFEKDNFDIEVYIQEEYINNKISGSGKQINLIPLYFSDISNNDFTGMEDEQQLKKKFPTLEPNYVEYFLDIQVDGEIDSELICKSLGKEQIKNIFADKIVSNCKKGTKPSAKDIINKKTNDFEGCD